ncbi:MAG: hypothetical protein FJ265_11035 [Planctomycetes bacterium]|nr:hypothetical protein [Planctomycetota bacterium]
MVATSRRSFLSSVAAAGAMAPFADRLTTKQRASAPKQILVLGGTVFLGPPFVRAAPAAGHTVTAAAAGTGVRRVGREDGRSRGGLAEGAGRDRVGPRTANRAEGRRETGRAGSPGPARAARGSCRRGSWVVRDAAWTSRSPIRTSTEPEGVVSDARGTQGRATGRR